MKIGLSGGLFVWLWMLAMPFSVQSQDLGSRVYESQRRHLRFCSGCDHHHVQLRCYPGGCGDDR